MNTFQRLGPSPTGLYVDDSKLGDAPAWRHATEEEARAWTAQCEEARRMVEPVTTLFGYDKDEFLRRQYK